MKSEGRGCPRLPWGQVSGRTKLIPQIFHVMMRDINVDMLTEWKMYDEALKEADVVDSARSCIYSYPKKILAILDLINDRDKTIEVCKAQFKKTDRKQVYFDRLQKEMTKEEWEAFIDDTIRDADEVFVHDYDDVEAQIYMKRKMYDHLVKFCMHTSYNAEENLEKYGRRLTKGWWRRTLLSA